ncbi:MAG TPA: hypothetical protein VG754_09270 [Verrucomicrobiae bacterium]|nr:hypothetical protein [Verrucomicrobiae bacterium]
MVATLVFVLVFGAAAIITFILPKTYAATARMRLKSPPPQADAATTLTAQANAAQSEAVLNPVVESLKLNKIWGRKFRVDEDLKTWESVTLLKQRMEVLPAPASGELVVRVYDDDGELAAKIANRVGEILCSPSADSTGEIRAVLEMEMRAEPSVKPVQPNIPLNLFVGAVGGFIIAWVAGSVAQWIATALKRQQQPTPKQTP